MEKKYAATYQLGNATVHINDSMISDDPDVQAEIDSEIATAAWAIIEEIIARGEEL
ncbi:cell division protein FtsZ [Paenibacillus sp. RUD330]|uniref:cell division protein FtsZ n=1 Tax=Paenibacillus sp. RUD330 TaxID=2023772 RepID=UPI0012FD5CEF|nr:cell division protein FtsZ [Paenibacillus sp. RUD330]ASS66247.2 cell division protein FtsZ [Paenibacillus sp. RUD330]